MTYCQENISNATCAKKNIVKMLAPLPVVNTILATGKFLG